MERVRDKPAGQDEQAPELISEAPRLPGLRQPERGRRRGWITRLRARRASRAAFDVVFYTPSVAPLLRPGVTAPAGGAETQVFLLSQLLAQHGVKVALISQDLPGGLPRFVNGVRIVARPPYRAHSPLTGKIREAIRIWATLRRVDAAVIVKRMYGVDVGLVALGARLFGRRFIYSSASVVDFALEKMSPNRRDLMLFHLGVRLADEIVVQTEEQVPLCLDRFERSPHLIKSVAQEHEPAGEPPRAFLWIGRVVSYKEPLAYVELARAVPEARFVMIGVPHTADPAGRELFARVQEEASGLENLELLPPRSRDDLAPLIEAAVAIVSTSEYEGMPNVLLEGWSRGIPALVLGHDPGGVVTRHGLGEHAAGSAERLAQQAAAMWAERERRDGVGERCRAYVHREHAPAVVAKQWIEVLNAALAGSGRELGDGRRT